MMRREDALTREIEALKADIERRRDRRRDALNRVSHLLESIEAFSATMRRLSINAMIEAAKAGEAGASFAVVASEIKQLANAMRGASEEAAAMLKDRDKD